MSYNLKLTNFTRYYDSVVPTWKQRFFPLSLAPQPHQLSNCNSYKFLSKSKTITFNEPLTLLYHIHGLKKNISPHISCLLLFNHCSRILQLIIVNSRPFHHYSRGQRLPVSTCSRPAGILACLYAATDGAPATASTQAIYDFSPLAVIWGHFCCIAH